MYEVWAAMRYDLIAHRCDLYDTEDLDQRIRAQLYMEQPSYYARYCEKYRSADPANLALLKCFLDLSVNAELFHQHKTGIIIGTNDGITVKQKQFTRLALEGNSNPFDFSANGKQSAFFFVIYLFRYGRILYYLDFCTKGVQKICRSIFTVY